MDKDQTTTLLGLSLCIVMFCYQLHQEDQWKETFSWMKHSYCDYYTPTVLMSVYHCRLHYKIPLLSLQGVEKGLSEQIGYLTQVATGQPHEGSTYGIEKVLCSFPKCCLI